MLPCCSAPLCTPKREGEGCFSQCKFVAHAHDSRQVFFPASCAGFAAIACVNRFCSKQRFEFFARRKDLLAPVNQSLIQATLAVFVLILGRYVFWPLNVSKFEPFRCPGVCSFATLVDGSNLHRVFLVCLRCLKFVLTWMLRSLCIVALVNNRLDR